jgi:hypothetical protein
VKIKVTCGDNFVDLAIQTMMNALKKNERNEMRETIRVLNYHMTSNKTHGLLDTLHFSDVKVIREYKGFSVCEGYCSQYLVKDGTTLTERVRVSNQLIDDILENNPTNYEAQRCIAVASKAKTLLNQ